MKGENEKLLLIGDGGHCKVIIDTLLDTYNYEKIGIISRENEPLRENLRTKVLNIPIIGTDRELEELFAGGYKHAFIAVGSIGDTSIRRRLHQIIDRIGFSVPNIIDKSSIVGAYTTLGRGVYIGKRTIVNTNSQIGDFAILNTASVVEHDCMIGDFVHVATGAVLCGNVSIGDGTHIGAGSVVKQGICIGRNTMIGMGGVVINNICDSVTAYGVPCREVSV